MKQSVGALAALLLVSLAAAGPLRAAPPSLADGARPLGPVLGQPSRDLVEPDDTLLDVAYRHRLGFESVARLNPQVNVWIPDPGTIVELPTQYVLPDAESKGLIVNVPEMRLYDFTQGREPEVFSIAIGDGMDPSLVGEFRIGAKRKNPAWNVPASIRAEKPELPAVVPPGPDNPLGDRWMTIGNTSYGIHGTNNPWSIGRQATHGCLRLYEDEMRRLYDRVPTGTRVLLVYQTVKLGTLDGGIYVEAHPDVYEREPDRVERALLRLQALGLLHAVDENALRRVAQQARGVPVRVGTIPRAGVQVTSRRAS